MSNDLRKSRAKSLLLSRYTAEARLLDEELSSLSPRALAIGSIIAASVYFHWETALTILILFLSQLAVYGGKIYFDARIARVDAMKSAMYTRQELEQVLNVPLEDRETH